MPGEIRLTEGNSGTDHTYTSVPDAIHPPTLPDAYVARPVGDTDSESDSDQEFDEHERINDGFEIEDEQHDFELGLFGCFNDPRLCLSASFLAPCLFGRTNILMARKPNQDPAEIIDKSSSFLNGHCVGYMCLSSLTYGVGSRLWHTVRRGNLRARYNIKGSFVQDLLVSVFCEPCSITQEDYEVCRREVERNKGDFRFSQRELTDEHM